jgi:hypothetical protein
MTSSLITVTHTPLKLAQTVGKMGFSKSTFTLMTLEYR